MNNWSSPDMLDTRVVFRVYAVLAISVGILFWGPPPAGIQTTLATTPMGRLLFFRLTGAALAAAGCFAIGFSRIEEPETRHRALFWFALGHLVVLLIVVTQLIAFGDDPNDLAPPVLTSAVILLFYFWQTGDGHRAGEFMAFTKLMNGPSTEQLRSRYEEHIREAAGQEERNRLARELHDSIKQQVFVMQTAAATAQARFDSDPQGAKAAIDQLRESAREAMTEMEAMLDNLRATPLENAGLVEALKKQCEALGFRTGARVVFEQRDLPPNEAMPPGAQQAIFRVAQEALANIGRHARARTVRVALSGQPGVVRLEVEDDGQGFDTSAGPRGMGIANMHSRAESLRGMLSVRSAPGEGTAIRLSVPKATSADIGDYTRRLLGWSALLVANLFFLGWRAFRGQPLLLTASVALLSGMIWVRTVRGYVRARRLRARSSWIGSPSHS